MAGRQIAHLDCVNAALTIPARCGKITDLGQHLSVAPLHARRIASTPVHQHQHFSNAFWRCSSPQITEQRLHGTLVVTGHRDHCRQLWRYRLRDQLRGQRLFGQVALRLIP